MIYLQDQVVCRDLTSRCIRDWHFNCNSRFLQFKERLHFLKEKERIWFFCVLKNGRCLKQAPSYSLHRLIYWNWARADRFLYFAWKKPYSVWHKQTIIFYTLICPPISSITALRPLLSWFTRQIIPMALIDRPRGDGTILLCRFLPLNV